MSELFAPIAAALASIALASLKVLVERFFKEARRENRRAAGIDEPSYADRIAKLTESLTKSSKEVDGVLAEIATAANERRNAVEKLEVQLSELAAREKETKDRIEALQKVPLEAIQHFEQYLAKEGRRSAWRDYALFGAGVLVSTVVAIILGLSGL